MNFQSVKQANGQDVGMQGYLSSIKPIAQNSNGKNFVKATVNDLAGEKHLVTFYGNTLPDISASNAVDPITKQAVLVVLSDIIIKTFNGNHPQHGAYIGHSGFWNGIVQGQTPQQQTQQPQPPQQQQQQPGQSGPDWDAIAEGKTKCSVICAAVSSGQIKCKDRDDADNLVAYILEARSKPTACGITDSQKHEYTKAAEPEQEQYEMPDDDIPF